MISDVLFEAVEDLDRYLTSPLYNDTYTGKLRERIVKLRDEALYLVRVLDTPPKPRKPETLAEIAERRLQKPRAAS